jgi:hypothetical protein
MGPASSWRFQPDLPIGVDNLWSWAFTGIGPWATFLSPVRPRHRIWPQGYDPSREGNGQTNDAHGDEFEEANRGGSKESMFGDHVPEHARNLEDLFLSIDFGKKSNTHVAATVGPSTTARRPTGSQNSTMFQHSRIVAAAMTGAFVMLLIAVGLLGPSARSTIGHAPSQALGTSGDATPAVTTTVPPSASQPPVARTPSTGEAIGAAAPLANAVTPGRTVSTARLVNLVSSTQNAPSTSLPLGSTPQNPTTSTTPTTPTTPTTSSVPPPASSDGSDPDRSNPDVRSQSGDEDGRSACCVQMESSPPSERPEPPSSGPLQEPPPLPDHGVSSSGPPHAERTGGT